MHRERLDPSPTYIPAFEVHYLLVRGRASRTYRFTNPPFNPGSPSTQASAEPTKSAQRPNGRVDIGRAGKAKSPLSGPPA